MLNTRFFIVFYLFPTGIVIPIILKITYHTFSRQNHFLHESTQICHESTVGEIFRSIVTRDSRFVNEFLPKKNAPTRVRFSWFYILFSYNLFIIHAVIRSFLGDMDIMRMTLLQGCSGDLHKSAGLLQSLDILCTAVAHTGTEAAE